MDRLAKDQISRRVSESTFQLLVLIKTLTITAWLSAKSHGCSKRDFKTPWKSPCNILTHIKPLCVFKLQSERRASTFEDLATLRTLPAFTLRGPEGSCSWKHMHGFRINPLIGLEFRNVVFFLENYKWGLVTGIKPYLQSWKYERYLLQLIKCPNACLVVVAGTKRSPRRGNRLETFSFPEVDGLKRWRRGLRNGEIIIMERTASPSCSRPLRWKEASWVSRVEPI